MDGSADRQRRDAVLATFLPNAPFDGWSEPALRSAEREAGFAPGVVFADGVGELATHYTDWLIRQAATRAGSLETQRTAARIRLLLAGYFAALVGHREAHRRLLGWLSLPANTALGVSLLARTADELWWQAGDRPTGFSHYTKRAVLGSIVATATLYWLDGETTDTDAVMEFVDRRLAGVARAGRTRARLTALSEIRPTFLPRPRLFLHLCRQRWGNYASPASD